MIIVDDFSENFETIVSAIKASSSIVDARTQYTSVLDGQQITPNKYAELMMDFEFKIAQMVTQSAMQMISNLMQMRGVYDRSVYLDTSKAALYIDTNGVYYSVDSLGAKTYLSAVSSYEAEFAKLDHDVMSQLKQNSMIDAQIDYQNSQTSFTTAKTTVVQQSRIDNVLKDVATTKADQIGMTALGGYVPTTGDFTGMLTALQALADRIASVDGNAISTISLGSTGAYS